MKSIPTGMRIEKAQGRVSLKHNKTWSIDEKYELIA